MDSRRRERHAKTLDIAQEEVLTCLGIYLYERLYKIWQKLRAEEQTWQMLFYVSVDALKKSFEVRVTLVKYLRNNIPLSVFILKKINELRGLSNYSSLETGC